MASKTTLRSGTAQRGITLVETCCTVTLVVALAGTALPSFDALQSRRVIEGVAAELATDLRFSRTEAVARREGVRWSLYPAGEGVCAVIHTGSADSCQCTAAGAATCDAGSALIKSTYFPANGRVAVSSNVASMRFDQSSATVTPAGTVRVAGRGTPVAVHHVVNILGRVRSCSPSGAMAGVPAC